jgi:hypothetical protein
MRGVDAPFSRHRIEGNYLFSNGLIPEHELRPRYVRGLEPLTCKFAEITARRRIVRSLRRDAR